MFTPTPKLATVLYGYSDDLIEVEGEQEGEVSTFAPQGFPLTVVTPEGERFPVEATFTSAGAWTLQVPAPLLEAGALLESLPEDWTPEGEGEVGSSDLLHLPTGWRVFVMEEGEEVLVS